MFSDESPIRSLKVNGNPIELPTEEQYPEIFRSLRIKDKHINPVLVCDWDDKTWHFEDMTESLDKKLLRDHEKSQC